jgi:16S rRNA (cytidine1402-2'-O)-methyltransferase
MTSVYFESPHRLADCLADLAVIMPTLRLSVCRELTKIHEEYRHGFPEELGTYYEENPPRGEITLVIDPTQVKSVERKLRKDHSENIPIPRNLA